MDRQERTYERANGRPLSTGDPERRAWALLRGVQLNAGYLVNGLKPNFPTEEAANQRLPGDKTNLITLAGIVGAYVLYQQWRIQNGSTGYDPVAAAALPQLWEHELSHRLVAVRKIRDFMPRDRKMDLVTTLLRQPPDTSGGNAAARHVIESGLHSETSDGMGRAWFACFGMDLLAWSGDVTEEARRVACTEMIRSGLYESEDIAEECGIPLDTLDEWVGNSAHR